MYILGFDIGGTKSAAVIAEIEKDDINFIYRYEIPTSFDWKYIIDELIKKVILKEKELGIKIDMAGISCGGPLSVDRKIILSPPNLKGWDNVHIVAHIKSKLNIEVYMENDADACALAEYRYGAGKGAKSMIFLTFGTGLGAGLILDGKLYRGTGGMAGEIGHIRMTEKGPLGYGKEGSLEGYASGAGIKNLALIKGYKANKSTESGFSAKDVIEAARGGDKTAKDIIDTSAKYLGRGLSILVDILNPDTIVIGSIFARAKDLYMEILEDELRKEALGASFERVKILPCGLGERIGDYGAVCAALDKFRG